jgi:predicted metal-dependent hydrolase
MTVLRGVVEYGSRRLSYAATFADRKTLAISVYPDASVRLIAPLRSTKAEIEARLRKRAAWVCRQQRYFDQFNPRTPARRYVSGETHLYRGRQYRLKLRKVDIETVRLSGGYLEVALHDRGDTLRIRHLLDQWYRLRAEIHFVSRFEEILSSFSFSSIRRPELKLRSMKGRWGSHLSGKTIILNPNLIRAPAPCIDYVITHEICHMLHPSHSAAFFRTLTRRMPDWEKRKSRLERLLA